MRKNNELNSRGGDRDTVYPVFENGGMPSLTTMLLSAFAAAVAISALAH